MSCLSLIIFFLTFLVSTNFFTSDLLFLDLISFLKDLKFLINKSITLDILD